MCSTSKPIPTTYHIKREWDREGSIKKFSFASSLCPKVAKSDHFFCLQKKPTMTTKIYGILWKLITICFDQKWKIIKVDAWKIGWFKNPVSCQTEKLIAATEFLDKSLISVFQVELFRWGAWRDLYSLTKWLQFEDWRRQYSE